METRTKRKKKMAEDAEPKGTTKLLVGLQITHSGPFIAGNTTHNWTGFPQRGNRPSRAINYSFCPVSFQQGYKTKAFSWNCGWNRRKALGLGLTASNENTCRGFLVTDSITAGTWSAAISLKVNHHNFAKKKQKKETLDNSRFIHIIHIFTAAGAGFSEKINR